jgi:type I restriction enzyme S subunit
MMNDSGKYIEFSASQAMYAATRLIIEGLSDQGTKPLGTISLPIGGGTPSRSNSDYFTGNIPWITVADLKLRQFAPQQIVTAREFITEDALKNSAARLLPAGSVVLATRVSVGKVGIAEVSLATNQDFTSFLPKPGLNNRFLAYCLISSTSKMQEATRGTTIKGIKRDQLLRLEFPFPDEITQENVVSYLDAVSEKGAVNAADAASRTLPKIIQNVPKTVARIEELAARIEEARELRRRAVEETDVLLYSAARKLRRKLLETETVKPVGEITVVTSGGTPDRSNPLYWNNGTIPWIKTGELFDGPIECSQERITEAGLNNSSAKIFPADTVLIALYGQGQTRGRTGILKIPATTNQACAAISSSTRNI